MAQDQIPQDTTETVPHNESDLESARQPDSIVADVTQTELLATISHKEERKIAARSEGRDNAWFGLGTFGMIGWSVAVPVVASIAVGLWIDSRWPSRFSWTLMLLFLGMVLGCLNAWHWLTREHQ